MLGTTKRQKEKNYKRETTFRLKPMAHVPGEYAFDLIFLKD